MDSQSSLVGLERASERKWDGGGYTKSKSYFLECVARTFWLVAPTDLLHLLLHVLGALLEEHLGGHLRDELLLQPPDRVVVHQAGEGGQAGRQGGRAGTLTFITHFAALLIPI